MQPYGLAWLEEPGRADTALLDWERLAREQPLALAGGVNLAGLSEFDDFIASPALSVLQPDLGKWDGIPGCLEVGRRPLQHYKCVLPPLAGLRHRPNRTAEPEGSRRRRWRCGGGCQTRCGNWPRPPSP